MSAKRKLLRLHKWIGLVAVLAILLQSITGAMLVYRWELARFLDPDGMVRKSEPDDQALGVVLSLVEKRLPEMEVQRVFYPDALDATYFLRLVNSEGIAHFASVDSGNGQIMRFGTVWRFPVEAALMLHYQPLSGKLGTSIVLLTGICILAMCITGIGFWWPRRGHRWRNTLAVNWRLKPRILLRQFHRTVGILQTPVLLVILVTGLMIGGEILLAEGPSSSSVSSGASSHSLSRIDDVIDVARGIFPQSTIRDVRFIDGSHIKVQFHALERNTHAVHQVVLNPVGLSALSVTPADRNSDLWMVLLPLHTGSVLGWIGRVIVLMAGLALTILSSVGLVIWLQKPRVKSAAIKKIIAG